MSSDMIDRAASSAKGIGTRIRHLRTKRGLSQQALAHDIGVSAAALSTYEIGERTPSLATVNALASYFHVSADYLLGLPQTKDLTVEEALSSIMTSDGQKLDDHDKKLVAALIEGMIAK